jgi:hypothetical protein
MRQGILDYRRTKWLKSSGVKISQQVFGEDYSDKIAPNIALAIWRGDDQTIGYIFLIDFGSSVTELY